jgi:5'-deoxynucleotidase YfbR-like HD superfamily hydrolase
MKKAEKVVKFYSLCNRLKDVVRSGWKVWHVERGRLESVAEHVYGTQMLAIAMWSEYGYGLDLAKVIMMLAVHELEEMVIGDVIPFEASAEEKKLRGREAVVELLSGLDGDTPV